jgi:superkiller protein 3
MGPWKRVTELLPDNASAWRNLGSTHFRMGRMDEAIEAFRTSNEIQPSAMAFYSLGTALFQEGRLDESIDAFERAVALNPSDPLAWGNLGSACRYIPGRETRMREALERGIAMMRERLDREPAGGASWARLASWYANLGRREDAAEAVRRALELARDDVEVMVAVAAAYLDLDDREAALRWLNSAVRGGHAVRSLGRRTAFRRLEGDPEFERILAQGPEAHGTRISHDVEGGQGR